MEIEVNDELKKIDSELIKYLISISEENGENGENGEKNSQ
jgi:hypothetical protein